jgi:hypothetical protein
LSVKKTLSFNDVALKNKTTTSTMPLPLKPVKQVPTSPSTPVQHLGSPSSCTHSPSTSLELLAGLEIQNILMQASLELPKSDEPQVTQHESQQPSSKVSPQHSQHQSTSSLGSVDEAIFEVEIDDFERPRNNPRSHSFAAFEMDGSSDEEMDDDECFNYFDMQCMTPPVRSDNPIYMDARFRSDHHYSSSGDLDVSEATLGLFSLSPPMCSSH